jgi:hypothetical protein
MAEEGSGVTDEQRAKVRQVLFEMLRNNGVEVSGETESFEYEFIGEYGKVTIDFEMGDEFADWAIRTSGALMNRRLDAATDALLSQGKLGSKPVIGIKHNDELAGVFAFFAMQGMIEKLRSAFYELGLETETLFEGLILSRLKTSGLAEQMGYEPPSITAAVKALSKSLADERKQFLMAQIDSFTRKPRLDKLSEVYPALLKVWQSAKKIYNDNDESETWRDMVKAKYPELTFDDDLLTRVTGKLEDLPEDIQAKLTETDGDHTPSTIALEHAARMCGATHYQYGTRYYHRLKSGVKTEPSETD